MKLRTIIPDSTNHPKQLAFINSGCKRIIVRAGRRGGKAHPLTARVYTPDGFKLMGNVCVGDRVLTPFGSIAKVEGVFPQGIKDIYKVFFTDGTYAECTNDHLWEICEHRTDSKWKNRKRILTTAEIADMPALSGTSRRPFITSTQSVKFNKQDVSIDPYLLGVLIGDGTMSHESVMVASADSFIIKQIEKTLPSNVKVKRDRVSCDYRLSVDVGVQINPIIRELKNLGLWGKYSYQKFIPDIYKYNTVEVRMAVIQGLLDTDGSVDHNGQPRFEQTSKQLADDFAGVIQSPGGLCTLRCKMSSYNIDGKKKETRLVYRQTIRFIDARKLFRLPRKKKKAKVRAWEVKRYIDRINWVRKEKAQCIHISDPRGLYLTDNLIATHNTVGVAVKAILGFAEGKRILYASPTMEQVTRFWVTVCHAFEEAIDKKIIVKNETLHTLEVPGTERRIRAKSAWNADTLRGDYADLLILDEWQLMNEDAWELVGAPMLLDNNGSVIFIYTPPSLRSRSTSKANDPQHAAKLFARARKEEDDAIKDGRNSRWRTFHFSSMDNPYISIAALEDITQDMSALAYKMEILAQDVEEVPGALWTRSIIERNRVLRSPDLERIVVAIDPSATAAGDEAGIIGAGRDGEPIIFEIVYEKKPMGNLQ